MPNRSSKSRNDRARWLTRARPNDRMRVQRILWGSEAAMSRDAVVPDRPEAVEAPGGERYQQELSRSLRVVGNVMITLSSITPASSVFIIIPAILLAVGTGSFLALVFAAVVGVFMAFCWAELCAAYPIAGGDYAVVWHAFKGRAAPLAGP